MSKAEDLGEYYRIPADYRDLNYTKYVQSNDSQNYEGINEYNSDNTERLDVDSMKELLLQQEYIQRELGAWKT